jgi:hypothetical protein
MNSTPVKIVVIHDNLDFFPDKLEKSPPLMATLAIKYGTENIAFFKHSNEGLKYVLDSLGHQKMVVLLDKNFEDRRDIDGIKVFEGIRERTSLVYIILTSVSNLSDIGEDNLTFLINHELFSFINFASDYSAIVALIGKAVEHLELRIDCVIEEWIMRHPSEKRNQPLVKLKDGRTYSMNEVLESIRKQTQVGIDFEKSLLKLSIELFSRQKLKLND